MEMLEVSEPGALNYFTFSRLILSTLSASRNPILTSLSLSEFLDSLLWVLIVPTAGLAFSLLIPRTLAVGVCHFRQAGPIFFLKLSISSLSSLDPYSDYVGINISLNNFSSLSFLNVHAPLFAPPQTDGRKRFLFSLHSFLLQKIFFILWDFNCHHPLWDSRGTSDPPQGRSILDWVHLL